MLEIAGSDCFKAAAILIVDDDEGMVRMAMRLLRELGFRRVASVTNGGSAVQKLAAEAFDLVLSDWNMVPMSGLELLQHIRKDQKLANIGFVMMTGKSDPDEVSAAKEAGVDGYLLKPFNLRNLEKQLVRAMARNG